MTAIGLPTPRRRKNYRRKESPIAFAYSLRRLTTSQMTVIGSPHQGSFGTELVAVADGIAFAYFTCIASAIEEEDDHREVTTRGRKH